MTHTTIFEIPGAVHFRVFFTARHPEPGHPLCLPHGVSRLAGWPERCELVLNKVEPKLVAACVDALSRALAPAAVKQHRAALRMRFDWLVIGQALASNAVRSVQGPMHVAKTENIPALSATKTRARLPCALFATSAGE